MSTAEIVKEIRPIVQVWGGKFMTSPELAEVEAEKGLGQRSLYLRGRSAVLGDPSPRLAAALFGIFPSWLFEFALPAATSAISAPDAVRAYLDANASWSRSHLTDIKEPERLAELLFRLTHAADATGLALFAGWQAAERPEDPHERVGQALMILREYRGGIHFAALRAVGLTIPEAVVADPEGGRERLLRTAWAPQAADELIAAASKKPDLAERWQRAEDLTDARMIELLDSALDESEREDLLWLLRGLDAAAKP
ncbi:hypothetical protein SAMN05421504_102554 [Amycolatopsis xylanica]|uniref:Uncharacterized protein n=1 Tax=Amycolatopsis xylanica TaxID=589385 RepID=A0A1H2ZJT0_9PSEU|nr:hypothetical protein [Amycolatopsis xylanica]SDX17656.1 hypothetical protein SAMN05421504_102554 [Amycolatopsis xylanica]